MMNRLSMTLMWRPGVRRRSGQIFLLLLLGWLSFWARPVHAQTTDPVFVGAGAMTDCEPNTGNNLANATANLLDGIAGTVFTLGDHDDPIRGMDCYDAAWGRHLARTQPVAGALDYDAPGAAGYYEYFGAAASPHESNCTSACKGYYSYNLGAWHIVALNSELTTEAMIAEQLRWLRDDLAANPNTCTLAYWNRPLFTSGLQNGTNLDVQPFWETLYHYGADVVLNGGDRHYERFAPQNPAGQADPTRGIRQFVVGTGGDTLGTMLIVPEPNSEVRHNTVHGVLQMTLHPTSYDWRFVPIAGQAFTDSGTTDCNSARPTLPDPIGYWRMQTFFQGIVLNSATEDVDASNAGAGGVTFEANPPDNNIGWNELESFNRNQSTAKFGANNSYLEVTSNPAYSLSNEVTLAAWVNLTNPSADQKIVGKLWLNLPNGSGYLLGVQDGQLKAEVYDANERKFEAKGGDIPATTWTHVAMTWQTDGQLISYINGVAVAITPAGASPIGNKCESGKGGCNVIIGAAPWDPAIHTTNGHIDEVLIFNQALAADAITQLAQRTFIVASSNNAISGCAGDDCTLETAIEGANAGPNGALRDRIHFDLPAPAIIQPDAQLPEVTDAVVIDGLTQPGASCSTWPPTIKVAIDGTLALPTGNSQSVFGLFVSANDTLARGLNIRHFSSSAIIWELADDGVIECNLIGTNLTGTSAAPNGEGIFVPDSARTQIMRNLIAGNVDEGMEWDNATGSWVQGNYIGTNISGTVALANGTAGINARDSSFNQIGGATEQARNLISGNTTGGIFFFRHSDINMVQGNIIGADSSGLVALGNGGAGIQMQDASNNTIGGKNAGNLIAYNLNAGVVISDSNFFSAINNFIAENRIYRNAPLGIDLGGDGVTANDAGDGDDGPNRRQNFPVLRGAVAGGGATTISGTLNSQANTEYLIEFYANQSTDPCQGETFLGFDFVTTDGSGNSSFSTTLTKGVPAGMKIAATASDMTTFETSEFSLCVPVSGSKPVVSLSPFQLTVNEAAGNATLTVALSPTVNVPITVLYSTIVPSLPANEVATPGSDYTAATNQSVVIPAGQSAATIQIPLLNDSVVEQNERFGVTLDLPANSNATIDFDNISSFNSVVTISDNDGPNNSPVVSLRPTLLTVNENAVNATLTVALSPTVNVPITVLYSTSVSSIPLTQVATAGSDYLSAANQSLVIPAGQSTATLQIALIDDTVVEQNERFRVALALPADSIATFANANFNSLITINDNDNPVSNTPPVANAQTVNLPAETAQSITLVGTDNENDPLTYRIITPPTNGALTGTPPALTYTPNPGFTGTDSFTFVANDGKVDSTSATVTLQVTAPPAPGDKQVYLPLVAR